MLESSAAREAMVYYRTTSKPCGTAQYGFGAWSEATCLAGLLILWMALAILFNSAPEFDKDVSSIFFIARQCANGAAGSICGDFPASSVHLLKTLRRVFYALPMVGASVVVTIALRDLASGLRWNHERIRISTVSLITLALGPGLLVNGYLKEFVGRPRPADSLLFGGDLPFVAAAEWSKACLHNCSFVSGEAAGIAWIICLLPLWPHHQRQRVFWIMLAIVITTDMLRVAFGRHYISDVVLGSLSTLVIFSAVAWAGELLTRRFYPGIRPAL
ncbi:phosphatase PAP2 family protein [Phyllobacterium pellucidum]|uniref:phosphatase PAP2 family protein n=1 Tax=Phyllobacterium pellucidum TaxID=2740464 RepID=UPI001D135247|nr:phosphatase PAP2 family protein [Phyllobacterium sp. T1018]UGY10059.1 phosphatase PAP2 family protein [Phyllobacterium sp. T1018]